MSEIRIVRRLLIGLALAAALAFTLAATADAQPTREDDFWECVGDHQDTDGIAVCCVFYGGDLEANDQECYIDFAEVKAPAQRGPKVRDIQIESSAANPGRTGVR